MDYTPDVLLYALLGGILPALFWLWCWLHEDRLHPEPRAILLQVFLLGMAVVPAAGFLQQYVVEFMSGKILVITSWAAIEEILKYLAAYVGALRRKECNEPVDIMIYMITAALGFSALENALFIAGNLTHGAALDAVATGNMRFMGASLLHVLTSGVVGAVIASEFYKGRFKREVATVIGLILSTTLHTIFNFFIMDAQGKEVFRIFYVVWVAIVLLLIIFSRVKKMTKPRPLLATTSHN